MNKDNGRYPYSYAADYIRGVVGYDNGEMKLSRADAASIMSEIALILDMDEAELKRKVADEYIRNY